MGGFNPLAKYSTPGRAESEEKEWTFHPLDALSMGAENVKNFMTHSRPKGVTYAEEFINSAPNDEERARRVGQVLAHGKGYNVEGTDPAVFASAASFPPEGSEAGDVSSKMPEWQKWIVDDEPDKPTVPDIPTDPGAPAVPGAPEEGPPTEDPGMASIQKQLGTLQGEIRSQANKQAAEYEASELAYKKELERVDKQSQVDDARVRMGKVETALNTVTEKLSNWEINPQRAFPNAFSKMAAVISVSMGAYAQGLSGGKLPNTALQIVNSAIDRDIEAQKAEYQKLKGMVSEKRNVYGMAMRLLGDERQADEMARSAAYRAFNAGVTSMSKQFGLTNQQNSQMIQALGLQERENFHRASVLGRAGKGAAKVSEKTRKEFGDLQALRNQITRFRELHGQRGPEDIVGQHFGMFGATVGVQIEQQRGLIARQLLMYTDSGRISDHDYTIMMKMVPGVWQSQEAGAMMLDGIAHMLDDVESARWDTLSEPEQKALLLNRAAKTSQAAGLGAGHLSVTEQEDDAEYWRLKRAQEKAKAEAA